MKTITKKAYAKVNLMLKVISKLPNNYHELQMINMRLDNLYDEITIKDKNDLLNQEDQIEIVMPSQEFISTVFIKTIIKVFKIHFGIQKCYDIYIKKDIPVGAGLGGGSMDAACLIDALLEKEQISLKMEEKINLFKEYGADIPYGFFHEIAIVEGIGEKITTLPISFGEPFVVVYPNIYIATNDVFKQNDIYNKELSHQEIKEIIAHQTFSNDLEKAAFTLKPELQQIKQSLESFGKVVMSGSGSSLIVFTKDEDLIKEKYCDFKVVKQNF